MTAATNNATPISPVDTPAANPRVDLAGASYGKSDSPRRDRLSARLTPISDRLMLTLGDTLSLVFAQGMAGFLALSVNEHILNTSYEAIQADALSERFIRVAALILLPLIWWSAKGHYSRRTPFWSEMKDVAKAMLLVALLDGFLLFVTKDYFSRLWILQGWALALVMIPLGRIGMRAVLKRHGSWVAPVLVIGTGRNAAEAAQVLESEPYLGYEIAGMADTAELMDEDNAMRPSSFLYRAGGDLSEALLQACETYQARFVVLAPSPEEMVHLDPLLRALHRARIPFAIIPPLKGIGAMSLDVGNFFSHDLVMLTLADNLARPMSRFVKRSFDLAVAAAALVALAPFFAVLSALIRRDGGPAFYGHTRVGEQGRDFNCLKFRTMRTDGDAILKALLEKNPEARAEWDRDQKLRHDPRITRIGHFLRKTSLDELPQLLNVLRGEMSLVGPRPVTQAEVRRYGEDAEYYLAAKPGITGLWQVSGRNNTTYVRRVQLDAWYVKNWSLWADIAILFKTVPVLITRKGAC
ncbi:undecaprenyl-phosphate galactose phosphotransferase WbaP [Parvibaculum sp. MBR-TMA-1.3b-4.2]|jgi:undecaprenyl-phosphate galactose phosphotransferase